MARPCPQCGRKDSILPVPELTGMLYPIANTLDPRVAVLCQDERVKEHFKEAARRLAPPDEPRRSEPGNGAALIACVVGIGGVLLAIRLFGNSVWMMIVFFLAGIIAMASLLTVLYYGPKNKEWEKKHSIWVEMFNKWHGLYYCMQDDCVFDPHTGAYAPSNKMNELLYHRETIVVMPSVEPTDERASTAGDQIPSKEPRKEAYTCQRCSSHVITERERLERLAEIGVKSSENGGLVYDGGLSAYRGSLLGAMSAHYAKIDGVQQKVDEIARLGGARCKSCGAIYCFSCIMKHAGNHSEGGKACIKCGGRFERLE
jgi:hypothetical protein